MIPSLIASARVVDGVGSLAPVRRLLEEARDRGLRVETLRIAALDHPWDAPPDPDQKLFKSGCAPILALARARALLREGVADVVLVEGREPLRTGYDHAALAEPGVDFAERFLAGRALLEAYICFPPVPLGFLLATGIASGPEALAPLLAAHPVTVTGGMNLARAPWNNPVLSALVVMHDRLAAGDAETGLLHGNGGLGGWQGVAILGAGGVA